MQDIVDLLAGIIPQNDNDSQILDAIRKATEVKYYFKNILLDYNIKN